MKKIFSLAVASILFLGISSTAHALNYSPLEPLPGLEHVQNLNFAQFLGTVFKLLLTAGALVAVASLVFAGISYIISGSGVEIGEAKKRMWASIWGLVILLGAWLMLYTINPTLLNFNLNSIGTGPTTPTTPQDLASGGTGGITINGGTGIVIYTSGSLVTSSSDMQKEADKCQAKGLHFKPTPETGTDDVGTYTVYKCQ
jgi:hypothetical protein